MATSKRIRLPKAATGNDTTTKVRVRVERNRDTDTRYNHVTSECPVRAAHHEEARVAEKLQNHSQKLAAFQQSVSQRVRLLRHAQQQMELRATEQEVQRRDHFVEQNIVMAHNPGRYNSLQVRVNRQQTTAMPTPTSGSSAVSCPGSTSTMQNSSPTREQPNAAVSAPCCLSFQDRAKQARSTREEARQLLNTQRTNTSTNANGPTRPAVLEPSGSNTTTDSALAARRALLTHMDPAPASVERRRAEEPLSVTFSSEPTSGIAGRLPRLPADVSGREQWCDSAADSHTPSGSSPTSLVPVVRPIHLAAVVPQSPSRESRVPVSRRLFMDLERARVQEHRRQKRLQQQVMQVLQDREEQRLAMETVDQVNKGDDPHHTGGDQQVEEEARGAENSAKKQQDFARYLDALRERVRQRAQHTSLPPVCGCRDNAWESHPSTCASNCPMRNNARAYSKALVKLLTIGR